jgi:hypothetical protein
MQHPVHGPADHVLGLPPQHIRRRRIDKGEMTPQVEAVYPLACRPQNERIVATEPFHLALRGGQLCRLLFQLEDQLPGHTDGITRPEVTLFHRPGCQCEVEADAIQDGNF